MISINRPMKGERNQQIKEY